MKKNVLLVFTLFLSYYSAHTQSFVLNEIATKNDTSLQNRTFEKSDWIELYNGSNANINLKGYYLSDDPLDKLKWQFKNGSIAKDSHIVVFASGISKDSLVGLKSNKEDISPYGYTYADNTDKTSPGTSAVTFTKFNNTAFGKINNKNVVAAKVYCGNPGALGYSYAGVHVKFENWNIEVDRSAYNNLRLYMHLEKDKKVKITFGQTGVNDWENYTYTCTGRGDTSWYDIPIDGNTGLLDLSKLTGISLVAPDAPYNVSFEFILFNIEWSVAEKEYFSTNFKLSATGDALFLSNSAGSLIDIITIPALKADYSYGRQVDGSNQWVYFENTTPEKSNGGTTVAGFCQKTIAFNKASGFYPSNQTIELSGASTIKYTLDGSIPTSTSPTYTSPIPINKHTVLKAACFDNLSIPLNIFTNTYFIDYDTKLPVWSISTDPDNLFDAEKGIYVLGNSGTYEETNPNFGANFWEDWEKPVHIEFFEEDGTEAFELDAGIKIFGNYSRANPKKSVSIHFRGQYGTPKLNYPLFTQYPGLNSFDDIILRGSGGDEAYLHFRDGFHSVLAKDLDFEKQKYRPCVVFYNGEYWGIHDIREKSNEDYFLENYNIAKADIDLITGYLVEQKGPTTSSFETFLNELKASPKTYAQIVSTLDISSFIDYTLYEIYIANYDWPANNAKYWRQSSTNGKWRWFLYDTDFSTAIYGDPNTQYTYDNLKQASTFEPNVYWPNNENSTILLRRLLAIPAFKKQFINRYCDLMNTTFVPQHIFDLLQTEVLDKIELEIAPNRTRWNLDVNEWNIYLTDYKDFWSKRAPFARQHLQSNLTLSDEVDLTLQIVPEGAGYIQLNTITIDDASWTGIYFKGIPVTLEAVPNAGYSFATWNSSALTLANPNSVKIIDLDLTTANTLTASFTGAAAEQLISISEVNYHTPTGFNTQDWLEIQNYGNAPMDISNWKIKDLELYNSFTIPQGTLLEAGQHLVIAEDIVAFKNIHPNIAAIGSLGFGFNNTGEKIYLINNRGEMMQSMEYKNAFPWATYAAGQGGSLELETAGAAIAEASNWKSVCYGGSPGLAYDATCPQKFTYLNEIAKENKYTISPNPANSSISIFGDVAIERIEFFDLNGTKLLDFDTIEEVNVSVLTEGLYLVKISNDSQYYFQKLLVQQ